MNPLFRNHPLPPPRPGNPVLDQAGLAELLKQRATHWPMDDMGRVVDERRPQGYPMAPLVETGDPLQPREPANFVGPGFVGPVPQSEPRSLPRRDEMRSSTIGQMMDPMTPVGEDEYRALIQKLVGRARPI